MEQIVRESTYPESKRYVPKLRLSPFLLIVFIMMIGFGVINMSVTALAQYSPTPSNPFPAYADIFPGQPASALEARGFSCRNNGNNDYFPAPASCIFTPTEGIFSRVEAIIADDKIHDVTFIIRYNTLQVGNLEMFLKMPTLHRVHRAVNFFLPGIVVIAEISGYSRRFSLFLSVSRITFTEYPL